MRLLKALCSRRGFRVGFVPPEPLDSGIGKYTKDYANLPERYLLRKTRKLYYKSEDHPGYKPELKISNLNQHYMERPWTGEYWNKTTPFKLEHGLFAEPIREKDWMWFRGDRVEILVGDDKGKQGIINYIVQERNWVCVEGLNCRYDLQGKSHDFPGVMVKVEEPLLVTTEIKLVDPSDQQACDVEWRYDEEGERVRMSKRTGFTLPIPMTAEETVDYKAKNNYVESKTKDTVAKVVEEVTYDPKLCTFDMDIMEKMGIKEDRIPAKTYWY